MVDCHCHEICPVRINVWGADLSRCGDNGVGLVDLTRSAHGLLHGLYHPLVARGLQPHFGKIQWTGSQRMCEALMRGTGDEMLTGLSMRRSLRRYLVKGENLVSGHSCDRN